MKTPILYAAIVVCSLVTTASTARAADLQDFVALHAEYLPDIMERTAAFYNKVDQIEDQLDQLPSEYDSFSTQMTSRLDAIRDRVSIGSYSLTIPPQFIISVPNEDAIDNLIDQLEDLADDLEEQADDADDDYAEDVAEDIEDLVDHLDLLEDWLTYKTNRLAWEWVQLGGEYEFF